jgi:putative hemolysin
MIAFIETDPPEQSTATPLDQPVFPHHVDAIPPGAIEAGNYEVRFAWTRTDLLDAQALRHSVFHLELGEGLSNAGVPGLDADERDPWFHHLLIIHRASGAVAATCRLQTAAMAATRHGFYSGALFELGSVPGHVLMESIEVGRACVASGHRGGRVLRLLWRGLARYMLWNEKRYVFGSCSVHGTEPTVAESAWRAVHARGALHDHLYVRPCAHARTLSGGGRQRPLAPTDADEATLPPIFESYLALGAKVCGAPAVDREFGTTDFLVLLDREQLDERVHRSLFDWA